MGVILIKKPGVPAKDLERAIKGIEKIYTSCSFGHMLLRKGKQTLVRKGTYSNCKYSTLNAFSVIADTDLSVVSFTHWAGEYALNRVEGEDRPPFRINLVGDTVRSSEVGHFAIFLTHYPISLNGIWSNDKSSRYFQDYQNEFFRSALSMGNYEKAINNLPGLSEQTKVVMADMDGGLFIKGEEHYHNFREVLVSSSYIRDELVKYDHDAVFGEDLEVEKKLSTMKSSYLVARDILVGIREHILLYRTSDMDKDHADREKFIVNRKLSDTSFPLELTSLKTGETIHKVFLDISRSYTVCFKQPLHDML